MMRATVPAILVISAFTSIGFAGCLEYGTPIKLLGEVRVVLFDRYSEVAERGPYVKLALDKPVCIGGNQQKAISEIDLFYGRDPAWARLYNKHVAFTGELAPTNKMPPHADVRFATLKSYRVLPRKPDRKHYECEDIFCGLQTDMPMSEVRSWCRKAGCRQTTVKPFEQLGVKITPMTEARAQVYFNNIVWCLSFITSWHGESETLTGFRLDYPACEPQVWIFMPEDVAAMKSMPKDLEASLGPPLLTKQRVWGPIDDRYMLWRRGATRLMATQHFTTDRNESKWSISLAVGSAVLFPAETKEEREIVAPH